MRSPMELPANERQAVGNDRPGRAVGERGELLRIRRTTYEECAQATAPTCSGQPGPPLLKQRFTVPSAGLISTCAPRPWRRPSSTSPPRPKAEEQSCLDG